jgi:hypothetical protein
VAEEEVVAEGSFPRVNPIKASRAQPEPHRVLLVRAKVAAMEPEVAVAVADKMVVQEVLFVVATMVHLAVKMAIVWHPEAVLYPAVHMVVEVE